MIFLFPRTQIPSSTCSNYFYHHSRKPTKGGVYKVNNFSDRQIPPEIIQNKHLSLQTRKQSSKGVSPFTQGQVEDRGLHAQEWNSGLLTPEPLLPVITYNNLRTSVLQQCILIINWFAAISVGLEPACTGFHQHLFSKPDAPVRFSQSC